LFDVRGFGWVWVGLVIWWVGLGWVDENRPTDNSGFPECHHSLKLGSAVAFALTPQNQMKRTKNTYTGSFPVRCESS